VLAHGFTQNARGWGPFLDSLSQRHEVVAVDLPGHGSSAAVEADLWESAHLLGRTGGTADYVGYSLGGRVSLHLALRHPELVRRLVLIGSTAGIASDQCRTARRVADEALAHELEPDAPADSSSPAEQERLDAFLDRWLRSPLFATLRPAQAELEARRQNTRAGLAASLRRSGTGTQEPLWDRLSTLGMPVLVMAGALDVRFTELGKRLVRSVGTNAHLSLVPGAGHACHLERPAETARIVGAFLR
jgi:2-succinyl-6-hydroxy-2,4-cyclohexadiene-1-carboxylate synthase